MNQTVMAKPAAYTARFSLWPYAIGLVLGGSMLLLGLGVYLFSKQHSIWHFFSLVGWMGLAVILRAVVLSHNVRVQVTSQYILVKRGILSSHSATLHLNRVESFDIDQGLTQRVLGYGNVTIRGIGGENIVLSGLRRPEQLKQAVLGAQHSPEL